MNRKSPPDWTFLSVIRLSLICISSWRLSSSACPTRLRVSMVTLWSSRGLKRRPSGTKDTVISGGITPLNFDACFLGGNSWQIPETVPRHALSAIWYGGAPSVHINGREMSFQDTRHEWVMRWGVGVAFLSECLKKTHPTFCGPLTSPNVRAWHTYLPTFVTKSTFWRDRGLYSSTGFLFLFSGFHRLFVFRFVFQYVCCLFFFRSLPTFHTSWPLVYLSINLSVYASIYSVLSFIFFSRQLSIF